MRCHDLRWLQDRLPSQIRALTVDQPFAWAIVHGHKSIENRKKPVPKEFLGEIVAIHASAYHVNEADIEDVDRRVRGEIPQDYVRGAIVGFARVLRDLPRGSPLDKIHRRWAGSEKYRWLLEDAVILSSPVECVGQLGLWRVPRRVMNRIREQLAESVKTDSLTAFSWGYKGWGNATAAVIEVFDAVEQRRGFAPPIFVDIRQGRGVRAEGFCGASGSFERKLGKKRYRWMSDLGNMAVRTRRGPMRLVGGAAVYELLGLMLRAREEDRRVVFFCSCRSPCEYAKCHRRLVSRKLIRAAQRLNLALRLEEWPGGGTSRRVTMSLRVQAQQIADLVKGKSRRSIDLGRSRPETKLLSLPVGSLVRIQNGRMHMNVSVRKVVLWAGRWRLYFLASFGGPSVTQARLAQQAKNLRRSLGLSPLCSRPLG